MCGCVVASNKGRAPLAVVKHHADVAGCRTGQESLDKAEISLALCDTRLMDEMVCLRQEKPFLDNVVGLRMGTANHDGRLDRGWRFPNLVRSKP